MFLQFKNIICGNLELLRILYFTIRNATLD